MSASRIYIYMRSWLYFRWTALPCQILPPIPGWPVPQVAMPTCPYVSPSSATHHESNLGDTFAFNLPSRCPPETCLPPPHTHSPFVCVLVCSQGPIETVVPCVEGSLSEASEGSARYCAARWHYGKVSIACHLKISLALVATVGLQQHLLPSLSCARIT